MPQTIQPSRSATSRQGMHDAPRRGHAASLRLQRSRETGTGVWKCSHRRMTSPRSPISPMRAAGLVSAETTPRSRGDRPDVTGNPRCASSFSQRRQLVAFSLPRVRKAWAHPPAVRTARMLALRPPSVSVPAGDQAPRIERLRQRLYGDAPARLKPRPGRTLDRRSRLDVSLRRALIVERRKRLIYQRLHRAGRAVEGASYALPERPFGSGWWIVSSQAPKSPS